jgi:ABC-type sugar transport system ATPase subunit
MMQLPTTNRAPPEPLLDVHNLCRSYGSVQALRDVSLTLAPGTIGLVGNNGAGKSTLLHDISNMPRIGLPAPEFLESAKS